MNIRQVVTKYGYSIVSKEVAEYVSDARRNPSGSRMKRLRGEAVRKDGQPSVYNCEKWEYLLYAPFVISAKCCAIMKKSPLKTYEHKTGQQATTATMAEESRLRMTCWMKSGCNAFEGKRPMGKPMSFWTEQDVLRFIVERGLPYASVYGDIVASDGENDYAETLIDCKLHCTGCQRTVQGARQQHRAAVLALDVWPYGGLSAGGRNARQSVRWHRRLPAVLGEYTRCRDGNLGKRDRGVSDCRDQIKVWRSDYMSINEMCGGVKGGPMKPSHEKIAETLREYAEWADANIYEVPIMLPDDLRTAADMLEKGE